MARKKIVNEELNEDQTTSASSLRPKSGTASTGEEEKSVEPSRFSHIAGIMGALAKVDTDTLKYFSGMLSSHTEGELGKGVPEGTASSNRDSVKAHASDAVGGSSPRGAPPAFQTKSFGTPVGGSEDGTTSRTPSQFGHPDPREEIRREVGTMFNEAEGLSEEFKEKAIVIFEAALNAKVALETAKIQDAYEQALDEEVSEIAEELEEKVGVYIQYVAEEWMKANEVAIESSLRNEIASELAADVYDAFRKNNVRIPEDEVDVVETLATKNEELEGRLAEAIQEIASLRQVTDEVERSEVVAEAVQGLSLVAATKLRNLAEGVEADDIEEFAAKVAILRENVKPVKRSTVETLMEEVDEENTGLVNEDKHSGDPRMNRYLQAIEGTNIKTGN